MIHAINSIILAFTEFAMNLKLYLKINRSYPSRKPDMVVQKVENSFFFPILNEPDKSRVLESQVC